MNHKPVMLLIRDGWGNPAGRKLRKRTRRYPAARLLHDELTDYPGARAARHRFARRRNQLP
jgi:hypothetical protein